MSVIAAIVRKDLRLLSIPAGVWLAFQAGSLLWFAQAPGFLSDDPGAWRYGLGVWVQLIGSAAYLFGALLAGLLVLEDPLRGTDAFWRTRPIARGRLLAAKVGVAVLLLVFAPVLARLAVWIGLDFSGTEMAVAGARALAHGTGFVLVGMAAACLSRTLAQQLFALVALGALQAGLGVAGAALAPDWSVLFKAPGALRDLPAWTALYLLPLAIVLPVYLQRRPAFAWALPVALVLLGLLAPGFVAATSLRWVGQAAHAAGASGNTAGVELIRLRTLPSGVVPPLRAWESPAPHLEVAVRQPDAGRALLRPAGGAGVVRRAGSPDLPVMLDRAPRVSDELLLALLERQRPGRVEWSLPLRRLGDASGFLGAEPAAWSGRIDLETVRLRELGRMPVQPDAGFVAGSNRVRLAAVQSPDQPGRPFRLVLEEREAVAHDGDYLVPGHRALLDRRPYKLDFFLLEIEGTRHVLQVEDGEGVTFGSVLVGSRRLVLPDRPWAELERGVVVKLRLERVGAARSVHVAGPLPRSEEEKP